MQTTMIFRESDVWICWAFVYKLIWW